MPHLPARLRSRRLQPLWQALHRVSLAGMNFGGTAEIDSTGEADFLRRLVPGSIVLDVGANVGDYTAAVLSACSSATVYAFEPASDPYGRLLERFAGDDRVHLEQTAVGAEPGSATLSWPAGHGDLASLSCRDLGQAGLRSDQTEMVSVISLDEWIKTAGIAWVDLLKIDVEGFELEVLRGAQGVLGITQAVQFEFGGASVDSRIFLRDLIGCLSGFEIRRMCPDGLSAPLVYTERSEIFAFCNYVALRRGTLRATN